MAQQCSGSSLRWLRAVPKPSFIVNLIRQSLSAKSLRPTVLVVDDEADIPDSVREFIEKDLNYRVVLAASGPEALAFLESTPAGRVDLIVADYRMVPMDGVELLRRAKNLHPQVPVVLFTAVGTLEVALAAINTARVSRFLTKPADPDALLATVKDLVESHISKKLGRAALARASGQGSAQSDAGRVPPGAALTDLDQRIVDAVAELSVTLPGLRQRFPDVDASTLDDRVQRLVRLGYLERDTIARPAILNVAKRHR